MSEIEQRMAATDNAMGELYEAATVYMDAGEAGELLAHRDFHDAKLASERAAWRAEVERLRGSVKRVEALLKGNGCDCECMHHWEDHDDDCERCFACRVSAAMETP